MVERTRAAVNEVIPGRLVQRGQIYTWQSNVKQAFFRHHKITGVVNFWPKVDPDLSDDLLDWYWQISCLRSEKTLERHVRQAADAVADYLDADKERKVLVLCEAGKTRSVFFCILVVAALNHFKYSEAHELVAQRIPGISLKSFMVDWLEERKRLRG